MKGGWESCRRGDFGFSFKPQLTSDGDGECPYVSRTTTTEGMTSQDLRVELSSLGLRHNIDWQMEIAVSKQMVDVKRKHGV